jgi:hypothetical protein
MPGDASVAQGNREIASSEAFQNETCIGDRTVALDALQRIAERFRRDCNIVDQSDLPGLAVRASLKPSNGSFNALAASSRNLIWPGTLRRMSFLSI